MTDTVLLSIFVFVTALAIGLIGAELGSSRLAPMTTRRLLAVAVAVAGVKMLLRT